MTRIIVGTAGYGRYPTPEGWKKHYERKLQAFADPYSACELNKTFYRLPQRKTARIWRKEAGENFVFSMKAWQALTHSLKLKTSPV